MLKLSKWPKKGEEEPLDRTLSNGKKKAALFKKGTACGQGLKYSKMIMSLLAVMAGISSVSRTVHATRMGWKRARQREKEKQFQ